VAALYRKYRPQRFDEVVGQEPVVRTLENAIDAGQIRQAYLFAPTANFSRSVLEFGSLPLVVSKVPALTWCDLGTPERVTRTLRRMGVTSSWLAS